MNYLGNIGLSTGAAVGSGTINQDSLEGKLTLDTTKLQSALASNFNDVKSLFTNATGSLRLARASRSGWTSIINPQARRHRRDRRPHHLRGVADRRPTRSRSPTSSSG